MHNILDNYNFIKNKINEIVIKKQLKTNPQIVAVTKTFSIDKINPLINVGHNHFGENKLQEAIAKWTDVKKNNSSLQLHMLGKLQSNKAKKAVEFFDYIHSLDNEKLANKISKYENELNKKVKLFIQVNVASEKQKSGIEINHLENFFNYCKSELSLNIVGLMCIPPVDEKSYKYFELLNNCSTKFNMKELSIGMSSDYSDALLYGSTFLRIGTAIFGKRKII